MKKLWIVSVLGLSLTAFAEESDTQANSRPQKVTKKHAYKSETKSTHKTPEGATTDTDVAEASRKTTEEGGSESNVARKVEHDAPGSDRDTKHEMKKHVVRDANGNIIK